MERSTATRDLDLYEIAFLAGGLPRLVDAALVAMVEAGRVRVHSPGQLAVADPTRRHPVEAAVLDAVGTRGHRSVDVIRWRLNEDDRILDVGRSLTAAGLLRRWSGFHLGPEPARTATGERVLRDLAARATTAGAVLVALHGRERMTDALLRASIFEPLPAPDNRLAADRLRHRIDAARESADYDVGRGYAGGFSGGADGMG
jgi:hypothetical protein